MTDKGTGPLANKLAAMRQSITGKLVETSAKLDPSGSAAGLIAQGMLAHARGQPPAPAPEPAPVGEASFAREAVLDEARRKQEEAAAASRKRMAFIVAYVKDPGGNPIFAERDVMYKVFTDERGYQHELLERLRQEQGQLPPPPEAMGREAWQADPALVAIEEQRAALAKRIKQADAVQTQLFGLLRTLTGTAGTGGAHYVPPPPDPVATLDTSSEDALGAAGELLKRLQRDGR
jgi:hypothetical protein